ncbi:MAG: LPS translocon maturation chaperone LptM [Woeseiaceae bacterium]
MKRPYGLVAAILSGLFVCACGQKGALFLPGDRSEMQTELPEVDRESLEERIEGAVEDEDENANREDREPAGSGDEDADSEPLYDPSKPPDQ